MNFQWNFRFCDYAILENNSDFVEKILKFSAMTPVETSTSVRRWFMLSATWFNPSGCSLPLLLSRYYFILFEHEYFLGNWIAYSHSNINATQNISLSENQNPILFCDFSILSIFSLPATRPPTRFALSSSRSSCCLRRFTCSKTSSTFLWKVEFIIFSNWFYFKYIPDLQTTLFYFKVHKVFSLLYQHYFY